MQGPTITELMQGLIEQDSTWNCAWHVERAQIEALLISILLEPFNWSSCGRPRYFLIKLTAWYIPVVQKNFFWMSELVPNEQISKQKASPSVTWRAGHEWSLLWMLLSATQGPLPLPRLLGLLQRILLSWVPLCVLSSAEEDTLPKVIPPSQSQPISHLCLMSQAMKARQAPPFRNVSERPFHLQLSPFRFQQGLCYDCEVKVTQSCSTLCAPMDYTVHGILQARILEWVAFPFSRGSFQPRDRTQVSRIAGGFFTVWATREALFWLYCITIA